jgi:N-acetylneuraminate synthase
MDKLRDNLLFIFKMADNHMGDTAHGVALIRAMYEVISGFDEFEFAFKLQYQHLDTSIHARFRGRKDVKYVERFEERRFAPEEFAELLAAMRECGFKTACTPLDEASVDLIEAQGIEIIKIASCSLTDWPLLGRVIRRQTR